ncbi:MAG: hypothetical protein ACTTJ3_06095 [Treponema sp.]
MKKNLIILVFCLSFVFGLYAQEDKDILEKSPHVIGYVEQDGYALVAGKKQHYWLYNTYIRHNGDGSYLLNKGFPNGWKN